MIHHKFTLGQIPPSPHRRLRRLLGLMLGLRPTSLRSVLQIPVASLPQGLYYLTLDAATWSLIKGS